MAFPPELARLSPLASHCDEIDSRHDCPDLARRTPDLTPFIEAYVHLVDARLKPRIDSWMETGAWDADKSRMHRTMMFLDYLARSGHVPEPQCNTHFIEWDERSHDVEGNEW